MKKIIALVWAFALLVSCGTARKIQQTKQEVRIDSTAIAKEANAKTDKFVDTTRTQHGKVTITEIEFYPPLPDDAVDTTGVADSSKPEKASSPLRDNPANVNLQDVGNIKGAVKSIKQTVIESDVEEKGESKESSEKRMFSKAKNRPPTLTDGDTSFTYH